MESDSSILPEDLAFFNSIPIDISQQKSVDPLFNSILQLTKEIEELDDGSSSEPLQSSSQSNVLWAKKRFPRQGIRCNGLSFSKRRRYIGATAIISAEVLPDSLKKNSGSQAKAPLTTMQLSRVRKDEFPEKIEKSTSGDVKVETKLRSETLKENSDVAGPSNGESNSPSLARRTRGKRQIKRKRFFGEQQSVDEEKPRKKKPKSSQQSEDQKDELTKSDWEAFYRKFDAMANELKSLKRNSFKNTSPHVRWVRAMQNLLKSAPVQ